MKSLGDLSVRAQTVLRALGIDSIEKLADTPAITLMRHRGCGVTTVNECRKLLAECGLKLKDDFEPLPNRWKPTAPTLRDYFAGQALCGIALWNRGQGGSFVNADDAKDAGTLAYQLADAMLAAREAKP